MTMRNAWRAKVRARVSLRVLGAVALVAVAFRAHAIDPAIPETQGVDIVERLGEMVPLDAQFADESGKVYPLRRYFEPGRPVVLALVYYTCPSLCNLTLNGMNEAFKALDWEIGRDFEAVVISINPRETADLAAAKKRAYIDDLGRPGAASGWHWLVGEKSQIDRVAQAVGFQYRYDESTQQYLHASAIYLVSPQGKLARYLYGIAFEPKTLKMGLMEAADGKIGSTIDRIIFYCHRYDPVTHRYTLAAMNVMRLGGAATLLLLATMIAVLKLRERRAARPAGELTQAPEGPLGVDDSSRRTV